MLQMIIHLILMEPVFYGSICKYLGRCRGGILIKSSSVWYNFPSEIDIYVIS